MTQSSEWNPLPEYHPAPFSKTVNLHLGISVVVKTTLENRTCFKVKLNVQGFPSQTALFKYRNSVSKILGLYMYYIVLRMKNNLLRTNYNNAKGLIINFFLVSIFKTSLVREQDYLEYNWLKIICFHFFLMYNLEICS